MTSFSDSSSSSTARQLLVSWANDQDNWVRAIVSDVLATRKEVSTDVLSDIYELFLADEALSGERPRPVDRLTDTAEGREEAKSLRLLALKEVRGVNALMADQEISFNRHLTVLFGENAAGKTGYVRILKRLAAVRSAEPVLPNIHGGHENTPPEAVIAYALGDDEYKREWKDEEGVPPFTRMSIFDSNAVLLHVDEALTYSYTPSDLALFPLVHQAIDGVKSRLAAACDEAKPKTNPFVTAFARGTEVYSEIETLGASTDLRELARLADFPESEALQLDQLREEVDALRPQKIDSALQVARSDKAFYATSLSCARATKSFDWTGYMAALSALEGAKRRHDAVTQVAFADVDLPGVLSEPWTAFIQAGEEYLRAIRSTDYPAPHEPCIYCRQPLEAAAVDLLKKYREYCTNIVSQDLESAKKKLAELSVSFPSVDLDRLAASLEQRQLAREEDGEPPTVVTEVERLVHLLTPIKERVANGEAVSSTQVLRIVDGVEGLASEAASRVGERIDLLTQKKEERDELYAEKSASLQDLDARLQLRERFADIRGYVDRAKWANRAAGQLSSRFPPLLRSLTEISKQASARLLNADFGYRFREECEALKAPRVEVDFPGRKGQAARRKTLVPDHRLSEILSEGEQKAIALADFLAEASLRHSSAPIIFDDPVTSLDYKRLRHVVERAVKLSADHQVIVFTHNIWFAVELLAKATDCSYYEISSESGSPGQVSAGTHPRWDSVAKLKGRVNTLIDAAADAAGEAQDALIESAYDKLRAWCEVVVEKEILAGVTQRHQAHVAVTQLGKIRVDSLEEAIAKLLPLYEKACRCMSGHSQPVETLNVRPSLEDLRQDWRDAQDVRDRYRS